LFCSGTSLAELLRPNVEGSRPITIPPMKMIAMTTNIFGLAMKDRGPGKSTLPAFTN
jgi:hypothetical protein